MFLVLLLLILLFLVQTALELKDKEKTCNSDFLENYVSGMVKKINDGTVDANEKLDLLIKIEKDNTINSVVAETNAKIKIISDTLNKMIVDCKEVKRIIENNYFDLSNRVDALDKQQTSIEG